MTWDIAIVIRLVCCYVFGVVMGGLAGYFWGRIAAANRNLP